MVFAVEVNLHKIAESAIAVVEVGRVGRSAYLVPYVETDAVAHSYAVDGHCVKYPVVLFPDAKDVGVEVFAITVE